MRGKTAVWLALLCLCAAVIACASAEIRSVSDLNDSGVKVGLSLGSAAEDAMRAEAPRAEIEYYTDNFLGYTAVAQGKLDAYVYDLAQMERAIHNGQRGVRLLPETMQRTVKIIVGISPASGIPDLENRVNAFIREVRGDGTLDDMYRRWVLEDSPAMPEIALPDHPEYQITVGTTGTVPPYSYYEGGGLTGYDIELAHRFAAWLGAGLKFDIYDFGSIVQASAAGKVDVVMSNLQYQPESDENRFMRPSEVLFEEKMGVMVRAPQAGAGADAANLPSLDQLNGQPIGSATGTVFDALVQRRLPDAQLCYYNSYPDMVAALTSGKIAAFACDEPVLTPIMADDDRLAMLPEYLDTFEYGFIFEKGERGAALCAQMSEFIRDQRESGGLERLKQKWLYGDMETAPMPEADALSGENGVLVMATEAMNPPFEFVRGSDFAGFDIELAMLFARRYGYGLEIRNMSFDAVLPAVQMRKADFGGASISITEERAQSVAFSEPYYSAGTVLAVLKDGGASAQNPPEGGPSPDGIASSFHKTFLRENRWQLFINGVATTLAITLLSILCGTAAGFCLFMLCRNGNPAANRITRFCLWLVQGMPMVVLLMILYYVVFGKTSIGGIWVAVIGFTLTFGSAVFGLLKMGVGAVDAGQYEAAYALGYSSRRTFFRVILPQALPHVLPAYRGEIVGLIKATAVVGYIAVQDLTKMGDIVRSRTYEAFFPLIAVTVIYFVLEGLIGFAIGRLTIRLNPRRRGPDAILKGIQTGDTPPGAVPPQTFKRRL